MRPPRDDGGNLATMPRYPNQKITSNRKALRLIRTREKFFL
jgi:hypothetical protein